MNGVIATIVVFLFSAMVLFALRADDDAMAKCQVDHSYEVCFHSLHR